MRILLSILFLCTSLLTIAQERIPVQVTYSIWYTYGSRMAAYSMKRSSVLSGSEAIYVLDVYP